MKVIDLEQGTPEWHAWRNAGVSASDISAVFGQSPYSTKWKLWAEKCGLRIPDDLERNPYVRRAKRYEHMLREKVARDRKIGLLPMCIEHSQNPVLRASLDGADGARRPWEFKIPSEGNFEAVKKDRENSVPARLFNLQVQQQMLCTGASEGFLVFGRIDDRGAQPRVAEYIVLPIAADPLLQERIEQEATAFHDLVVSRVPPAKDPERDVFAPETEQDAEIWANNAGVILPLLHEKAELQRRLAEIEAQVGLAADPIKKILDKNKAGEFSGLRVIRVAKTGAVHWEALVKSLGADPKDETTVSQFRKPASNSYQIKPVL